MTIKAYAVQEPGGKLEPFESSIFNNYDTY